MGQQTLLHLRISALESLAQDLAISQAPLVYERNEGLDSGVGANQASAIFADTRTLTTGANETLDLNGVLSDLLGVIVAFTKVKCLYIRNKGTTALTVGGAAANGFVSPFGSATDVVKIPPGGCLLLFAPDVNGFAVVAATGDMLKIANAAGASCDYDIIIIGV